MGCRLRSTPRDVSVSCGVRVVGPARTTERTHHTRRPILHVYPCIRVPGYPGTQVLHYTHVPHNIDCTQQMQHMQHLITHHCPSSPSARLPPPTQSSPQRRRALLTMRRSISVALAPADPILHIYRGLLRQASYLPPVCQPYIKQQIVSRFRRHAADQPTCPQTKRRVRQARHDLRFLYAATNGLVDNLYRILLLVFGRTGSRRRLLIHALLRQDPPVDSAQLEAAIARDTDARTYTAKDGSLAQRPPDWLDKWDIRKLRALAASQAKRGPAHSPRPDIKPSQTDPAARLPRVNIWERPLPAKLARSKLRKEYVRLINRILPPLPTSDWQTLRALALGHADSSALCQMPPRRPPAAPLHGDHGDHGASTHWRWRAYATEPVRSVDRASSRSQRGRTGLPAPGPHGQSAPIGLRRYTPRLLRRLYAKVWEMTPAMEAKPGVEGKWDIAWGKVTKDVPVAAAAHTTFFEGAPEVTRTGKDRARQL